MKEKNAEPSCFYAKQITCLVKCNPILNLGQNLS